MSAPRDYGAFLGLLSALVPIDVRDLQSDRSLGGYLALRVAADQFLHDGRFAFDLDFYRDEGADGGVVTRLADEPATEIASGWLVGMISKATAERFLTNGLLDRGLIRSAIAHDSLLRVAHGEKIELARASLNAISLMRGLIPSRRPKVSGPRQDFDLPSTGVGH